MTNPIFRLFRSESGCISYMLGDPVSRKVCLLDPRVEDIDLYKSFIDHQKLKVVLAMDSHTHADHYSATHWVAREFGVPVAMGAASGSARADLRLKDGQSVEVGAYGITALETPGHTPDSLTFIFKNSQCQLAFTGDTLFIGGSGRTDFPGADPEAQYESITKKLAALDPRTFVLPGHDYSGLLFSTLDEERRSNPHWTFATKTDFIEAKRREALESTGHIPRIVEFNQQREPKSRPRLGSHTLCATACVRPTANFARASATQAHEKLRTSTGGDVLFLDLRESHELELARVDGMRHLPMGSLLFHWDELQQAREIHLFCQRGNRSALAAETLSRLGLRNVVNVDGGMSAWTQAGLPIQS